MRAAAQGAGRSWPRGARRSRSWPTPRTIRTAGGSSCCTREALAAQLASVTDVTFPAELRPAFTRLLAHLGDALAGAADLREAARAVLAAASGEALLLCAAAPPALHARSLWRELQRRPAGAGRAACRAGRCAGWRTSVGEAEALLDGEPALAAVVLRDGSGADRARLRLPRPARAGARAACGAPKRHRRDGRRADDWRSTHWRRPKRSWKS